jgi:hypothetical protein
MRRDLDAAPRWLTELREIIVNLRAARPLLKAVLASVLGKYRRWQPAISFEFHGRSPQKASRRLAECHCRGLDRHI